MPGTQSRRARARRTSCSARAEPRRPVALTARCYVHLTRVLVDNSKGADAQFAGSLQAALTSSGFEVELLEPSPTALYDTSIHFVVEGVAVRVLDEPAKPELAAIVKAVREAEASRRSERRRVRVVPIYRGQTSQVLAWVDVFGSDEL